MATIRPNDSAPAEKVKYLLPSVTFDLAQSDSFETEDRTVLSDAEVHPWLGVEYPEVEEVAVTRSSGSVPYEEDVLAAPNSKAFDSPPALEEEEIAPVAVDAGLDQGEKETVSDVAVTLAATDEETPRKNSAKKGE